MKLPFLKKPTKPNQTEENPKDLAATKLSKGITSIKDIIAPPAIEVDFNHLKINHALFRTLFVAGYPRFVSPNWLAPLIEFDHSLDIAMFVYPIEGKGILDELRRKIGEMEAEIQTDIQRGRIPNVHTQIALEDARKLQEQLAKGAERFFQFGLYITVPGESTEELESTAKKVEATLGSLMIVAKPTILQMEDGFLTTIPVCTDKLMITRNMDTTCLATTFPFTSSELTANEGILYGINEHNDSLIIFDRFSLENANEVLFGKAGSGKSLAGQENVLYKDQSGLIKQTRIGKLIEELIEKHGVEKIDEEMEGVINPGLKVFTFDKNLKGKWAKVTVAARKPISKRSLLYRITTKSGRQIRITPDHNIIVLRNGKVRAMRGQAVKIGESIPLPRFIPEPENSPTTLNLLKILKNTRLIYINSDLPAKLIDQNYKKLRVSKTDKKYDRYLKDYKNGRRIPLKYFVKILKHLEISLDDPRLKNIELCSTNYKKSAALPANFKLKPEFFKLLGYLAAEGTTTKNAILISNKDKKIKRDIKRCFKALGITCFEIETSINTSARILVELIKAVGSAGYSHQKRATSLLFTQSNTNIASFLQAYFEGDGTIGSNGEVSATSKSKELISDLVYLLLRFGIVGRIRKKFKRATNSNHQGNTYYQIVISGQKDLRHFTKHIGFITREKNEKLQTFLNKEYNTNVDVVPSLRPIFKDIYKTLYSSTEIKSPSYFSDIKNGKRAPSREALNRLIKEIEKRVKEIKETREKVHQLKGLPRWEEFAEKIARRKGYNHLLWQELGYSWRLMKKQEVVPMTYNMFRAVKTVNGRTLTVPVAEEEVYDLFQTFGESLRSFDIGLWNAVLKKSNTSYEKVWRSGQYLAKRYRRLQLELRHLQKKLKWLKILANSDLFWDPIVKIEKIKNKDEYVYDLTVDNEVFLAGFGGMFVHNSYCVKAEILRSLMFGTEIIVIDPENEYRTLCRAVEGEYVDFSFQSPTKINPFDLSQTQEEGDQLAQKILSLHSLLKIMLGKMSPDEEAILDRALVLTYKQKGITQDPATQRKEPPLMEDLYKTLFGMEEKEAKTLANRLERYVKGSLAGIFNQKSNVEFTNPFTVFGIKDLETELRPAAMFIILDFIWNKIKSELKKRILVVDEAWYLMKYEDSALFLYSIAKRARKYYLGLTTITQDVEDFLESKHGKAIIQNSSVQILMKQSPAAIDKVGEVFYLSEGEKNLLLAADIGHGLFFAGLTHVAIHVVASEEEHRLITTKPAELIEMRKKTIEEMKKKEPQEEVKEEESPPIEEIEPETKKEPEEIEEEKSGKMKVDEQTRKGLQSPRTSSGQPEDS